MTTDDGGAGSGGPGYQGPSGPSGPPAFDHGRQMGWPEPPGAAAGGPVPIRPLDLGDVLDGTFRLLRAEWRSLLFVTGVFYLPIALLSSWLQRELLSGPGLAAVFSDPEVFAEPTAALDEILLGTAVVGVLAWLIVDPIVIGAVCRVAADRYLGQPASWRAAAGTALRRALRLIVARFISGVLAALPAVVGAAVLVAAIIGGETVLVIVAVFALLAGLLGSMLLWALFTAVIPAVIVEDVGPLSALGRSTRLLRPRLWGVLGIMLLATLIATIVAAVLGFPFSTIGQLVGGTTMLVLLSIGTIIESMLSTPLTTLPQTLLYFDGRIRREGLDLELLAEGVASADHRR